MHSPSRASGVCCFQLTFRYNCGPCFHHLQHLGIWDTRAQVIPLREGVCISLVCLENGCACAECFFFLVSGCACVNMNSFLVCPVTITYIHWSHQIHLCVSVYELKKRRVYKVDIVENYL